MTTDKIFPPVYDDQMRIVRDNLPFKYYFKIGSMKPAYSGGSRLHKVWLWCEENNVTKTCHIWPEYISFPKESYMLLFYLHFGEKMP